MRWLITGARGQLGSDLGQLLDRLPDAELRACGSAELDVTDRAAIGSVVAEFRPDVIVNAAAYTAVDAAETDFDRAYRGERHRPRPAGSRDGTLRRPAGAHLHRLRLRRHRDGAVSGRRSDEPAVRLRPDQAGRRAGGARAGPGHRVRGAYQLAVRRRRAELRQDHGPAGGQPADRVRGRRPDRLADLVGRSGRAGWSTWFRPNRRPASTTAGSAGSTSWHGFARAVFAELGADPERVLPTSTEQFPRPAPRPAYSVLSDAEWLAAGLPPMPDWRAALATALNLDRPAYLLDQNLPN